MTAFWPIGIKQAINGVHFFSTLVTSGSDGRVIAWDVADGSAAVIEGEGHSSQVAPQKQFY